MSDLRDHIRFLALELSGPAWEDAWHSLREAGADGLPHVVEIFGRTSDPGVRAQLVRVVSQYRSDAALPFPSELLRDPDGEVWKAALDGLVSLGGRAAVGVLDAERSQAAAERREWIDEAVQQMKEAGDPIREDDHQRGNANEGPDADHDHHR